MPYLARPDDGSFAWAIPGPRAMETSEMATFKKTYKPNEKVAPKGPPISAPGDTKRSFDARPKPSDDRRREERARPGQHIDQAPEGKLLDSADGDDS